MALVAVPTALALPVYEVGVTYVTVTVTAFGETLGEDVPVPVPAYVGNTPHEMAVDAHENGVPLAGLVAHALPHDDTLLDLRGLAAAPLADEQDLLPDGSVRVNVNERGEGRLYGEAAFRVQPLAEKGIYDAPVRFGDLPVQLAADAPELRAAPTSASTDAFEIGASPAAHPGLPYVAAARAPASAPPASAPLEYHAAGAAAVGAEDAGAAEARAVALAAAVAAGLAIPALLGWALYHRVAGHDQLRHAGRKAIYDLVGARPGVGVADVANASGLSYSTAVYHLDRLTSAGLLVAAGRPHARRYYRNGGHLTEGERLVHQCLQNPGAVRVLETIRANPNTYRAALAATLGVATTTVNWHLKPLLGTGLVVERREGRNAYLAVDEERLRSAVAPITEKLGHAGGDLARIVAAPTAP